jgi:hypothetical protein
VLGVSSPEPVIGGKKTEIAGDRRGRAHCGMAEKVHYGIDNLHPLFNRKTELVWDGKYDEYGRRREVEIAGCAPPLQKIETNG